jgi:hypothetical protein
MKNPGMELKDLSSNWRKLQPTLPQKKAKSSIKAADEGRERVFCLKRKHVENSSLQPHRTTYPRTKRMKRSEDMEATHREQKAAAPIEVPPTIRSIAQANKTITNAPDRVNDGLSQTHVAILIVHSSSSILTLATGLRLGSTSRSIARWLE